jgi:hypothetical protein
LFHGISHELLFGTFWANDVLSVCNEAFADHATFAAAADEAIIVPVTTFEWDESGTSDTCDGFAAGGASFAE